MNKETIEAIQQGDTQKFYQSRDWRLKRKEIVDRDNYECQMCKDEGRVGIRDLAVHHIKHLRNRIDLALISSNLITLCSYHHNIVHPEKNNKKEYKKFTNEERW